MRRFACAFAASAAALLASATARADASAWFSGGGGLVVWKQGEQPLSTNGTMTIDLGVGTSPDGFVIVGGFVRIQPIFGTHTRPAVYFPSCKCTHPADSGAGNGVDLAALLRIATHGFQSGALGFAFDGGVYHRAWGAVSTGGTGGLTVGGPLGLQLSVLGSYGSGDAMAFGAVAAIDVLRLTVYRQNFLDVWPNPSPAQRRTGSLPAITF